MAFFHVLLHSMHKCFQGHVMYFKAQIKTMTNSFHSWRSTISCDLLELQSMYRELVLLALTGVLDFITALLVRRPNDLTFSLCCWSLATATGNAIDVLFTVSETRIQRILLSGSLPTNYLSL